VPIYHNQAIWPFVTAYWVRAGQRAGSAAVVDAGIRSLEEGAALNLSNMENFDLVTGASQVRSGPRTGPVVDSRRQLWSVAGYLSMVQNVVFGADVGADGIRFRPCVTSDVRKQFPGDVIELRNFVYRGTRHLVRLHLPARTATVATGICAIDHVEVNGAANDGGYLSASVLRPDNTWNIYLKLPAGGAEGARLRRVDVSDERALFAPSQPRWCSTGGIAAVAGHVVLRYEQDDSPANVSFRIYRDGRLYDANAPALLWTDPEPMRDGDAIHSYAVAAVDRKSGNVSHPSPPCCCRASDQEQEVPARELMSRGGSLVDGDHFENWGKPDDELAGSGIGVNRDGVYALRVKFSNGNGPVNTGLCCGVKRVEVEAADTSQPVAGGYVIMPQSGNWGRWDLSSPVLANLRAGRTYVIRLFQDAHCRNMSFLQGNERYTAGAGGGAQSCDFVNVAGIELSFQQGR
jgi:hypothetical protein